VYRGRDAVYSFLASLQYHEKLTRAKLADKKPIVMTPEDWRKFKSVTECHNCNESLVKTVFRDSINVFNPNSGKYHSQSHKRCYCQVMKGFVGPLRERKPKGYDSKDCIFCKKPLLVKNYKDVEKDLCHITGKYRGAAHNACNLKLRIKPKMVAIPVVSHNLKGYDGHLLMQATAWVQGEISSIPNNPEKYISFSLGNLRFVDSLNFMMSSLDVLVNGSTPEDMKITKNWEDSEKRKLLLKKGIYLYEYMDSFERSTKTELPPKEEFSSKLAGKGITDDEYTHTKKDWAKFGCKTLGDYHNLYMKTNVMLLADVFENFQKVCMGKYRLDPAHYYTAPGLSWDALLKKTGVELELLTDLDLFIEKGMRGGISMGSKQYAKANNPRATNYDPTKLNKLIMYLDANNLYGWAMSLPLPKGGFKWKRVMPTEEQIMKLKENSRIG